MTPVVLLRDVSKRFGAVTALAGLSLEVPRGLVFALLGPNGAGKTTTIRLILGLISPDAGELEVLGGSPRDPAIRRRIGLAPQTIALYGELSARENLALFAALGGVPARVAAPRIEALLARTGLAERAREPVARFSGGMQRRLNLAAALVHDPELIVLDEPTAGVDPQSREAIFELIRELRREGRSVLFSTHYLEEAERLADRVAIVDHGRVLAVDSVGGLIERYGGPPRLTVEREDASEVHETAEPLALLLELAAKGPIRRFRLDPPRLDQVFLRLTGRDFRD
ncbi:MAG: ABC transporter ATP-binding protein [Xanthomonadales bacterium]|nr:ABC transporter ATP-binding protein [Xanthomonadales bacterium]